MTVTLLNVDYYHEVMKPIFADWAYLWLQKQHIHGIERHETLTYIMDGASARSDVTAKVAVLDLAIIQSKVNLGELSPMPAPTLAHQKSLSNEGRSELEHEREQARLAIKNEIDPDKMQLFELQLKQLEKAKAISVIQSDLVTNCLLRTVTDILTPHVLSFFLFRFIIFMKLMKKWNSRVLVHRVGWTS